MVFSSLLFLGFFLPCVLMAYYAFRGRAVRNFILFASSILFYAWGEPVYVWLILLSIAGNCAGGYVIGHSGRRFSEVVLFATIALNLGVLVYFKYLAFFGGIVDSVFNLRLRCPEILLPIGISFYTFQAISYLVDVYRGDVRCSRNPFYFGTYLAMFPQLIAGPIVRYETIVDDLLNRRESWSQFETGCYRFIVGLAKKVLVANTLALVADSIFGAVPDVGAVPAWVGLLAYTLQIYYDFSGYSDMAIGLGLMFGFRFLENFNYPYSAVSITDFWRRWHISLSTFFRDYVYIPLGGNRVGPVRWLFNIAVVWALTGIWHGASLNFVLWGMYYGVLLIGEKLVWGGLLERAPRMVRRFYALALVMFGWLIFRVESITQFQEYLAALSGAHGFGSLLTLNLLGILQYIPGILIMLILSMASPCLSVAGSLEKRPLLKTTVYVCLLCLAVCSLIISSYNPFIYFRF